MALLSNFHLTMKSDPNSFQITTYSNGAETTTIFEKESLKKPKSKGLAFFNKHEEPLTTTIYKEILQAITNLFRECYKPYVAGGGASGNYYTIEITIYDFNMGLIQERMPAFREVIERSLMISSANFFEKVFNPLNTSGLTLSADYSPPKPLDISPQGISDAPPV